MSPATRQSLELHQLVGEHCRRKSTGLLSARRGKLRRVFCFEEGRLIYAASNLIEEQLGVWLVEQKQLSRGDLEAAAAQADAAGKKLPAYLMEQGFPPPEVLTTAVSAQSRQLLSATLAWSDGEFRFDPGQPDLAGEPTARVAVAPLLMEHLARQPLSSAELRAGIGPPDVRPNVERKAAGLLEQLQRAPLVDYLLSRCDGSAELGAILADSPAGEDETLRVLLGLVLLRAVVGQGVEAPPAIATSSRATTKKSDVVSRDELIGRLTRSAESDHYDTLGLDRSARAQDIRDAYYYLARRYHPDRFRSSDLLDLLPRVETYFGQVTEAYNTLHDPKLRAAYDELRKAREESPEVEADQSPEYLARQNFARAKLLIDKQRYHDALRFLENAVQLDESRALYHLELGRLLIRNPRRRADAETHIKRAIEIDPTRSSHYLVLGQLLEKMSRLEEAAGMFQEVLRWEPGNREAKQALARLGGGEPSQGGRLRGLFRG